MSLDAPDIHQRMNQFTLRPDSWISRHPCSCYVTSKSSSLKLLTVKSITAFLTKIVIIFLIMYLSRKQLSASVVCSSKFLKIVYNPTNEVLLPLASREVLSTSWTVACQKMFCWVLWWGVLPSVSFIFYFFRQMQLCAKWECSQPEVFFRRSNKGRSLTCSCVPWRQSH